MTNIPTDLLRTLVAVVDLRSFTKAASSLGFTQPAVSAQIKRLQCLLGGDLFDRSVQGISLTPHGEMVVSYARRLLSINDQIVQFGRGGRRPELVIRIGTSNDHIASMLPAALAGFRHRWRDVRFVLHTEAFDPLVRDLRSGNLDLVVGLSLNTAADAHHSWSEEMVWVGSDSILLGADRPVPLVTYGEACACHQLAVAALKSDGLQWEAVFTGPSLASLSGAVTAGLGVMAITRRAVPGVGMIDGNGIQLPKLADLHCGVFVREGGARSAYEQLADEIGAALQPGAAAAPRLVAVDEALAASPAA